ncbi:MAG: ATP-grasp domain-containing protein [Acidobacteria bacterium]|nr:ATP-grasp domain-containing protein [Acidobacteriota bacterium]
MSRTVNGTVLCLSSYEKGQEFIRESKRQGWHVIFMTSENLRNAEWPHDCIDEFFVMPTLTVREHMINAVSYLARTNQITRLVALDEFDLEMAASLREHLRLPGMGETITRYFRDKLAMRLRASSRGVRVPEFSPIFNYDDLRAYLAQVPGPWVLKPRSSASAIGIRKIRQADEIWPLLDQLGDAQSHHLIEHFIPGEVFHVDSVVADKEVLFSVASRYGVPPMNVSHEGGIFTSRMLRRKSGEAKRLRRINKDVIRALGLVNGVTHAEFILGQADGEFYFLEIAARVAGANIPEMIEAGTGVNLWAEWAKVELAEKGSRYEPAPDRDLSAGIIITLARQEWPDLAGYDDEEIVWRMGKRHHAGLIVAAPQAERVAALLDSYFIRFHDDFHATMPVPDQPTN